MTVNADTPAGLVLSDDLLFASQITGHARALGQSIRVMRSVEDLLAGARKHAVNCVIVDLEHPGLNVAELMEKLNESGVKRPRVVGYGSHVNVESLRAAREAGCDPVLPRSAFVEALTTQLADWLNEESE